MQESVINGMDQFAQLHANESVINGMDQFAQLHRCNRECNQRHGSGFRMSFGVAPPRLRFARTKHRT